MLDEQPDGGIHGECAAEIHRQAERIGMLELALETRKAHLNQCEQALGERDSQVLQQVERIKELAAQNQQLRLALQNGLEYVQQHLTEFDSQYGRHPAVEDERRLIVEDIAEIESAISLPDLASQHLNRVKAEALREAGKRFAENNQPHQAGAWINRCLIDMADAIEKGEGNATD